MGAFASSVAPFEHVPHEALICARARNTRAFASSHDERSEEESASSQRCAVARSSETSARHAFEQSPRLASRSRVADCRSRRALRRSISREPDAEVPAVLGGAGCDGLDSTDAGCDASAGAPPELGAISGDEVGDSAGSAAPPHAARKPATRNVAATRQAIRGRRDAIEKSAIFPLVLTKNAEGVRTLHPAAAIADATSSS